MWAPVAARKHSDSHADVGNDALVWNETRARSCLRLSSSAILGWFMSPLTTSLDALYISKCPSWVMVVMTAET